VSEANKFLGKLSKENPEKYISKLVECRKLERQLCGKTDGFYRAYWIQQAIELTMQLELIEDLLTKHWDDLPEDFKNFLIESS